MLCLLPFRCHGAGNALRMAVLPGDLGTVDEGGWGCVSPVRRDAKDRVDGIVYEGRSATRGEAACVEVCQHDDEKRVCRRSDPRKAFIRILVCSERTVFERGVQCCSPVLRGKAQRFEFVFVYVFG